MNSAGRPLETKSGENAGISVPATLVWCGFFLVIGVVMTLLGFSQDRPVVLQIGLVLSAVSAFCGVVRITVWGSK